MRCAKWDLGLPIQKECYKAGNAQLAEWTVGAGLGQGVEEVGEREKERSMENGGGGGGAGGAVTFGAGEGEEGCVCFGGGKIEPGRGRGKHRSWGSRQGERKRI